MSKQSGLELSATFVFDYPTIAEMRVFLETAIPQASLEMPNPMEQPVEGAKGAVERGSPHRQEAPQANDETAPIWLWMSDTERKAHITDQV